MEFVSKPMSEVWKSTKRTFTEIMDFNDSVIGSGKQQQQQQQQHCQAPPPSQKQHLGGEGTVSADTEQVSDGYGLLSPVRETGRRPASSVGLDSGTARSSNSRERDRGHQSSSNSKHAVPKAKASKTPRPVSEDFYHSKREPRPHSAAGKVEHSAAGQQQQPPPQQQQKESNARHSLNTHIGKIWKDLRTLNMINTGGSKTDASSRKSPNVKLKSSPAAAPGESRGESSLPSALQAERREGDKALRSHRAHSHSRSRQGSLSESQHFRSNSTDRASVIKYKEALDKGRPFLRSTSDDSLLVDQTAVQDDDEDADDLSAEKMKTRILSMWNNVRYGWTVKTRTAFSLQKPIWVLGKSFQNRPEEIEEAFPGLETVKSPAVELFKREFASRIWLTYRREFPQLPGSSYTSDCGWGCMLRSGQMMLAQGLVQHFLGKDWNYYNEQSEEEQRYHHEIVRWFGDQLDDMSPFSLHQLVELGKASGKKAGDWYGPASVAHIFKEAMDQATDINPLLQHIRVYVAQDCTVYKGDVIKLCRTKRTGSLQPVYSERGPTLPATGSSPATHQPNVPLAPAPCPAHGAQPPGPDPAKREAESAALSLGSETDLNGAMHKPARDARDNPSSVPSAAAQSRTPDGRPSESIPDATEVVASDSFAGTKSKTKTKTKTLRPKSSPPASPTAESASPTPERPPLRNGSSHGNQMPSPRSQATGRTEGDQTDPHCGQTSDVHPAKDSGASAPDDGSSGTGWCAVVIMVPVRLGGDEVNPIYISSVQALFTLDCCIGIIGGKPKHSLYYIGFQEEKLIHLDPHYCQPVVDMKLREFSLSSFHCMSPRKMTINKMDPSCTVGFYLRTEADFHQFCEVIPQMIQGPSSGPGCSDYPMFILREGSCTDWNDHHSTDSSKPERYLRVRHVNQNGQVIAPARECEDFVFLDS